MLPRLNAYSFSNITFYRLLRLFALIFIVKILFFLKTVEKSQLFQPEEYDKTNEEYLDEIKQQYITDDNKLKLKGKNSSESFVLSSESGNQIDEPEIPQNVEFHVWEKDYLEQKGFWNFRKFTNEEIAKLSILGRRLFLHEDVGNSKNNEFLIYVHEYGPRLHWRLITRYTNKTLNPFENCSVHNCRLSYDKENFHKADAVVFPLHFMMKPPSDIERKNFDQRWVWLSDEGIFETFTAPADSNLDNYNNYFNWSMTYRTDSDVPIPYGRTVPIMDGSGSDINLDIFSKKSKTVAIMGSACTNRNGRWLYARALKSLIDVDTYGLCGEVKCPGLYNKDCPLINSYKFYLAFENSNCKDYITEKVWWNALEKKSVPIVMGFDKSNYEKLLPPFSFIHVEDFETPADLAKYIRYLSVNKDAYNSYHSWRANYKIVNEHGYFQSNIFHYCRLCEALNYNDRSPKTYSSMQNFFNVSRDCNKKHFYFRNFTFKKQSN
ncbi:UNVERIFIED_CONTAM: hypothetical protein RMT77_002587 [Armadillidium vulgare]